MGRNDAWGTTTGHDMKGTVTEHDARHMRHAQAVVVPQGFGQDRTGKGQRGRDRYCNIIMQRMASLIDRDALSARAQMGIC